MVRAVLAWAWMGGLTILAAGCGQEAGSDGLSSSATSTPAEVASEPAFSALPPSEATPQIPPAVSQGRGPGQAGDRFDYVAESDFLAVRDAPYSTFSIDVDTASYTKARQYLMQHGALPPPDAVRIEEFLNYFDYGYAPPTDGQPFAVHVETAGCPWRNDHRLVRIGIKGRELHEDRPPANLVFLVDVSGSMDAPNRLPLVKQGLEMLSERLEERDRVAIVVYAGAAGLVLPPTSAADRQAIRAALHRLHAGGSTNGGEGIALAYRTALDNFRPGGVNRVILCTDGDFNVGTTSTGDLVRFAQQQAQASVFLTVLGFGIGNHNAALLEEISNRANGNYAFIDSVTEARKVLVQKLSGTLVTIAKDVKIQVEFNPARVAAYRLIGYENRRLADRDFNDDTKDAGEVGAGHTVTALYEVVPPGGTGGAGPPLLDEFKYQSAAAPKAADAGDELLTVKLRCQLPEGGPSEKLAAAVKDSGHRFEQASGDFRFAAAVACFGMRLRGSRYSGAVDYAALGRIAAAALGNDESGYRREFMEMVRQAARLSGQDGAGIPDVQPAGTAWAPPRVWQAIGPADMSGASRAARWLMLACGLVLGIALASLATGICLALLLRTSTSALGTQAKPAGKGTCQGVAAGAADGVAAMRGTFVR